MRTNPSPSWPERLRGLFLPGTRWFPLVVFAVPLTIGLLIGLTWVAMHRAQPAAPTTAAATPVADSQHPPLPAPTAGDLSTMPTPTPGTAHIVQTPAPARSVAHASSTTLPAASSVAPIAPTTTETPPQIVERTQPLYPAEALREQEQGTVRLNVSIDAQGVVQDVQLVESSHSRALDRAAIDAVREWKFHPATRAGQPVASTIEVPLEFRLEDR
jgi:protein TonB